jgi:hypothetical protein
MQIAHVAQTHYIVSSKGQAIDGEELHSFKRTNALIQYGNNFSAYDYLIQLPFTLL